MEVAVNQSVVKKKIARASFVWVTENISHCWNHTGEEIVSSKFHSHGSWRLAFHIVSEKSHTDCECQFLEYYLYYEEKKELSVEVTLCILDNSKNDALKRSAPLFTFSEGPRSKIFLGTVTRSTLQSQAAKLSPEDTLTLRCDLTLIDVVRVEDLTKRLSVTDCHLSQDMGWLLDSASFADVTLDVGRGTYRAHKSILASRSPVFRAMFEQETPNNLRGEIFLPDIEPMALGELLRFIYTGRSPNLDNMADTLMVAADKYGLQRLRDTCEDALIRRLSFESAASTLILADQLNASVLRQSSINFICANLCEVTRTNGWNTLVVDHIELALDVFKAALPECCTNTMEPPAKTSKHP